MSLINEALKRTEAQRRASSGPEGDVTLDVVTDAGRSNRSYGAIAILAVCISSLCAGAYLGARGMGSLRPVAQVASAQPEQAPAQELAPAESAEPCDGDSPRQDTEQATEASLIVKATLEGLDYCDPAEASAASAAAAVDQADPMPSADSFRLSAIMRGPDGATAIINGRFITVGQTIDGATLVKLGKHTAELEIRGRKLTIQM